MMIKLIAIISMIIDHTGMVLYPGFGIAGFPILRIIGRIAMPLFAYSIAKGFYYTSNKPRYFGYMFFFATLSQIPFHYMRLSAGLTNISLNIMVTWFLAMIFLLGIERAMHMGRLLLTVQWTGLEQRVRLNLLQVFLTTIFLLVFPIFFLKVVLAHFNITIDFGLYGIILPALFYIPLYGVKVWKGEEYGEDVLVAQEDKDSLAKETKRTPRKRKEQVAYSVVDYFFVLLFVAIATFWLWPRHSIQQYAVLAVFFIPLTIKFDKSIRLPKLFFYLFYPVHMIILVIIHNLL